VIYLLPATLEEALGTYPQKTFVEEALGLEILMPGDGRNAQVKVPKMGRYRPRAYKIDYYRLQEFCGDNATDEPRQPSDERDAVGNGQGRRRPKPSARKAALPPCYGNQLDGVEKCLICPFEADCEGETPADKSREERLRAQEETAAEARAWFGARYPVVAQRLCAAS